jgi:WD40 repeat protein
MGAPGKEKFTKQITTWQGKQGIRLVAMRDKPRREIITGDNTGIVTVWDIRS